MLTEEYVREHFEFLKTADYIPFWNRIADEPSFTITGTDSPHSGTYTTKAEIAEKAYKDITSCLAKPMLGEIRMVLVSGEWAVVELFSYSEAKNGRPYNQELCWVCRYLDGKIVEARVYLDSAATKRLEDENLLKSEA
jgi:uncharacterized protein